MKSVVDVPHTLVEGLKEAAKARGISVATFANDAVCRAVADARLAKWQAGPRPDVEGVIDRRAPPSDRTSA